MNFHSRLAAYYPCDNTHGRSLGEDVKGTNNATAGVVSAATGKVRQGMFLLASGAQFRSVPNAAAIQQIKGACLWVKFSTVAADQTILSKGNDATDANTSIKLWFDQSADGIAYTVGDGASATTVTTSGQSISANTWYHVHVWNDGSRIGIALDGTLRGSGTARAPLSETGLLYLGSAFGGGTYLDGILDEVALFATAPTLSDGAAHYNGGTGSTLPLDDVLPGTGGKAGHTDPWTPPSFAKSDDATLYMAQGRIPVQRFDGVLAKAGVEAPNTKVTIASSGSGSLTGKRFAYLRNLDAEGRVSSLSPLSDVHDTFGTLRGDVTGASNEAPIILTSTTHGLTTGDKIRVTGQLGNTAANGEWTVTRASANTVQLNGSVGNGDWRSSLGPGMSVTSVQAGTGGVNAVQSLAFSNTATGGSFTLSYEGEPTTSITYNATASAIQAALRLLTTVGVEGVTCAGGPVHTTPVTITFSNELQTQPVSRVTVVYTGAAATVAATVTQTGSTGQNEIQTLDLLNSPTGGTFTVTFDGQTTGAIAYNANAATVEAALEALSNITVADLTTTGGSLPGTAITVEFGGTLAESNVAQMTINPASLTGSGVSMAISTPTPGVAGTDAWQYMSVDNVDISPTEQFNVVGNASVSSGTFTLSFPGSTIGTTAAIAWDATGLEVLQAIWTAWGANREYDIHTLSLHGDNVLSDGATVGLEYSDDYSASNPTLPTLDSSGLTGGTYSIVHVDNGAGTQGSVTGSYTLTFDGQTTVSLSDSDGRAIVQSALESLPNIGSGNVEVLGGAPGVGGIGDLAIHFQGSLAGTSVATITATVGVLSPSGSDIDVLTMLAGGTGGAVNEVQRITTTGTTTEGTFKLTYSGQETASIAHDASAATVDAALEDLSNISTGDVTCTGGPLPGTVIDVEFTGNLAGQDVTEMTVDDDDLYRVAATTQLGGGPLNELVSLAPDVTPQKGTFTLTYGGQTTSDLTFSASAASIQSELESLSTIGTGNVVCTGGPINSVPVAVEFQGTLSSTNVGDITATNALFQTVPSLLVTSNTAGESNLNEVQVISVDGATGGTYTLTYSAQTTAAIPFDSTASGVQDAIEALSTVGNGNVGVTGGPLTSSSLRVEFTGALGVQAIDLLTFSSASLSNGGWTTGANKITYTDVAIPSDTGTVRRQILRSKPGASSVFYIDVNVEDVVSNTFSSVKTDDELTEPVVLKDSNGQDVNLNRHGEPPNWKRSVASFQNRLFYAVDYVEKPLVTISGDTITGVATDWPNVFDSRTFYGDGGGAVGAIDPDAQTAALTDSTLDASSTPAQLTLRTARPDSQRVYSSYVTATETLAESVNIGEPFTVALSERDGEMKGQFTFDGRLYVAFDNSLYLYTFQRNPNQFPSGDGRMQLVASRGMVNHRCATLVDNVAFVLDRQGIYSFDGNEVEPVNEVIKTFFTGRDADVIKWQHQDSFHAAFFPQQRTCRFFVVLDGGPYPRHALCHNVDEGYWWVEEYPWPITASCSGTLDGQTHVFLGSTSRRVFTLDGVYEGARESTDTLRGTVTSAGCKKLTASAATFSSALVGLKVRIVEGTGFGQTREIVAVSGTTLTLMTPWSRKPTTDSVFQIAGVSWTCRTGKLKYTQSNERTARNVEILWEPNTTDQLLSFSMFKDWSTTAVVAAVNMRAAETDGVKTTKDSDRFEIDLTNARGHVSAGLDGMRQAGITGDSYLSLELQGTTNQEAVKLHGIAVGGVS